MPRRTLTAATALAVLFSSAALVAGTAGSAAADSSKVLPVKSAGDIVVDGVHQKIFISDPYGGTLIATDYSGTVLATLTGLTGVDGLALSADSGQLYAAVPGDDSIVSVETQTVTRTARYATGDGTDPEHLALAGGKIWFGYGSNDHGDIGSLDLSGAEPVVTLGQDPETDYAVAPKLASTPGAPNVLAAGSPDYNGSSLGVYDVSTGTANRTAQYSSGPGVPWLGITSDLALTPDGSGLVTANPGDHHRLWRTSDLTDMGSYPSAYHPDAVAIAPDGTVAAGTSSPYDPDLYVFTPGTTTAVRQYDLPDTDDSISGGDEVVPGGLAWEPGGSRLFAVTSNSKGDRALRVLTDPTKSAPTMTVTAPASAPRAKSLTVKGTLKATLPLPAGTPLTVTRTDMESPSGKSLGTKALGTNGAFSFTDTPPAGGKVTYKVSYAGDATHTTASASASVAVSRATPSLTLNHNGALYSYGTDVSFTAHLGTTYKNRTVEIWADPFGTDKPKKLVKRGTVNSKGNLSATVDMTRDTTVTAVFAGDARYASKTAKSIAYAKVKVSTSVAKQYRTAKIGSTSYAYFHKKTDPVFTTTMTYYKNRSQKLSLEIYYQGKWYDAGWEYFKLGTSGKSVVTLGGTHDTGYRMRMRSSYVNNSSGDNVNSTTHGAWKYFIFTK
ncbi:Ig-like domain repeat protein [Streptomyces sp. NBC_00208]|uniref:Ig-like domain repeat protein n=1 Tax=Streptomyces sp. NBC_00208 TaxID=2975681 RepID=UPI002E2971FB|nr:Ig-like domain repeat protein [Streptomyces sp. NBC_00208]